MRFMQASTTRDNIWHVLDDDEFENMTWAHTICGLSYSKDCFVISPKPEFEGNFCKTCEKIAESRGWVTGVKKRR